ncbi:MAG: methyltransferase domain-containing protein [Elainellaceae cyanobacterium]
MSATLDVLPDSETMKLKPSDIEKLEQFFDKIKSDTYPEPPSGLHTAITQRMIDEVFNQYALPDGAAVLDIGCGQGVALELFLQRNLKPVGITLNPEDVAVCQSKGYEVYEMDQSFLDFPDATFDFIWCRHCLEHSIFPYFTLSEVFRVMKPGAYLYIEVPAPDTSCCHQDNQNHYSTLGKSAWRSLIQRTGFQILELRDISFQVPAGPDTYWAMIQQKPV